MSKIETDFTELAKQINAKIKEAAEALKAANALAKSVGVKHYDIGSEHWGKGDEQVLAGLVSFDPVLNAILLLQRKLVIRSRWL
jgi:hypothetical protein